ncbi:MAG: GbsR/MarR family transcriptional regulator [Candidatus Poribacteria bacterium]
MGEEGSVLEQAQDKFADAMARCCSLWGLSRLAGQIFGVLFFNEGPLSLNEISERLKASKSNVSVSVRQLQKWKAVKKVWIKGDRKDYYQAEPDFRKIMFDLMTSFFREEMGAITVGVSESRRVLEENLAYLSDEEKRKAQISIERLKKIEEFYGFCKQFLQDFLKPESSKPEEEA